MKTLNDILAAFEVDIRRGYSRHLSESRAWKYASELKTFDDRAHFERFINRLLFLNKKYKTNFFTF